MIVSFFFLKQDEWTGEQKLQYADVPEDIEPEEIRPMGNYAVSITWPDGFSQVTIYMFVGWLYHQNAKNYTSKAMQHFASSAGIFVSMPFKNF